MIVVFLAIATIIPPLFAHLASDNAYLALVIAYGSYLFAIQHTS